MATATSRLVDIHLVKGQIRLMYRPQQNQLIGYAYHLNLPILLEHAGESVFNALKDAVSKPTNPMSIDIVRQFAMSIKHNNHATLKANDAVSLAHFTSLLTEEEIATINSVQEVLNVAPATSTAPQSTGTGSRLEQFKADLQNNIVFFVFRKKGGEVRPMLATLNQDLIAQHYTPPANYKNRGGRPATRIINVFDLGINEWRKFTIANVYPFNAEPAAPYMHASMEGKNEYELMWFKLPLNTPTLQLANGQESMTNFLTRHFGAPTAPQPASNTGAAALATEHYTIPEMVDVLRQKVVRLVFQKKGTGDARVMYATLNQELIQTYEKVGALAPDREDERTPEERLAEAVERQMIKVFDIEVQEWRYATVSNLLAADPIYSHVPSWVEYDPEIGDWFATMRNAKSVNDTYSGEGFAGLDMLRIDKDRLKFEAQLYKYQTMKAEMVHISEQDTSYLARLEQSKALLTAAFAQVKAEGYTSQDLEVFDSFKVFAQRLEEDFKGKLDNGAVNYRLVLSEQKALSTNYIVMVTLNWGRDVYYLHPRFIIGATSHKVYADRTGIFDALGRASLSDGDRVFEKVLEQLVPFVTGRRRQDLLTKPVEGEDIRRVKRIQQLVKNNGDALKAEGISITQNKKLPAQFKVMIDRKQFVLFNHEYIYDLAQKKFLFARSKEVTYANSLEPLIQHLGDSKAGKVLQLMYIACDLRRSVLDESGNHI